MKILVVNQYVVPPECGGGTRHIDLARVWSANGHEVRLVGSSFNHFAGASGARIPRQTQLGEGMVLRSLYSPGYAGNGVRRIVDMVVFALVAAIHALCRHRPDIIVGSSPQPFAAFGAFAVAKLRRVPFVFEIRDLWPQTLVDLGGMRESAWSTKALYSLERLLISKSDVVVAVPPATDQYLSEHSVPCRRLVHIPNGSATLHAEPASDESMKRHGVSRNNYFAYAGSLGAANGVDALVEAMGHLPGDSTLLIMGDGPERARLEKVANELAPSRVLFTGQVAKGEALGMLRSSLANIFHLVDAPVFRYGLSPNKLMDYLAAGRPIVYAGPQVPNPASKSGVAIEAKPGDARSIAAALLEVTGLSADERSHLGQRGAAFSHAEHSTETLGVKYLEVFRDCL